MMIEKRIAIYLEPREDGGLRAWSDDVPGLILSHSDQQRVINGIGPSLTILFEHKKQQSKS